MAFEDDMTAAGHRKILKDAKYFVTVDETGKTIDGVDRDGEPVEVTSADCNGNPISPHVWVPSGKKLRAYKGDNKKTIKDQVKNKSKPDIDIQAMEVIK